MRCLVPQVYKRSSQRTSLAMAAVRTASKSWHFIINPLEPPTVRGAPHATDPALARYLCTVAHFPANTAGAAHAWPRARAHHEGANARSLNRLVPRRTAAKAAGQRHVRDS